MWCKINTVYTKCEGWPNLPQKSVFLKKIDLTSLYATCNATQLSVSISMVSNLNVRSFIGDCRREERSIVNYCVMEFDCSTKKDNLTNDHLLKYNLAIQGSRPKRTRRRQRQTCTGYVKLASKNLTVVRILVSDWPSDGNVYFPDVEPVQKTKLTKMYCLTTWEP